MSFNNQFVDAEKGLNREQYNKWIKEARKKYLGKFPTNSLLFGDNHYKYDPSKGFYCESDLSEPLIGNLNASQIAQILDTMDEYTIMSLMCGENLSVDYYPDFDLRCFLPVIHGKYVDSSGIPHFIYSYPNELNTRKNSITRHKKNHTKQIYVKYYKDSYISPYYNHQFDGSISANEVLFRILRLPVSEVLGAINAADTKFDADLPYDDVLCDQISIINDNKPKEFIKIRK